MTDEELCYLPAWELAKQYHCGALSPVDVVDALSRRIARIDPKINAYVTLDLKAARADAERKAKVLKQNAHRRLDPLYGVPVAIKDDLEVKGLLYTCGSRLCQEKAKDDDVTVA